MAAAAPAPILVPTVALERPRDATSAAVLRYFEGEKEQEDAFDHLTAICHIATRSLFLPKRDGMSRKRRTREWIQMWLVAFLAPYHGKTQNELIEAANGGAFKHIGNACQKDLLDAIRSATAKKNVHLPEVSLSEVITEDGATRLDLIGTIRQDAPSSFLGTRSGFEEGFKCLLKAFDAVMANREELRRLDLLDGMQATLANAGREDESYTRFHARVVETVAAMRGVSLQAARAYLRRFRRTIEREMKMGNPALRAIYLELVIEPPTYQSAQRTEPRETEPAPPASPRGLTESFFASHGCAWDDPRNIYRASFRSGPSISNKE